MATWLLAGALHQVGCPPRGQHCRGPLCTHRVLGTLGERRGLLRGGHTARVRMRVSRGTGPEARAQCQVWRAGKRGLRSPFRKTLSLLPPMPPGSPSLRGDASEAAEVALGKWPRASQGPGPAGDRRAGGSALARPRSPLRCWVWG